MNKFDTVKSSLLGEEYLHLNHESGLEIYIIKNKLSSVSALFGTRYGSVDNRFKNRSDAEYTVVPDGIAHFLEHKMFENPDGVDTFEKYAKVGASANAFTSFDMTAYLFTCSGDWGSALKILLSTVTDPYFTKETVEKEQGIIAQEIKMGEDSPGRAQLFGLLQSMYEKNNVKIEIAGTVESIAEINADLLYRCYNVFYNLRNMVLIISGDVDEDAILQIADETLKTAPPFDIISESEHESDNVYQKHFIKKMQVSAPLFSLGIKDNHIPKKPLDRAKRFAAMSIASNLIFSASAPLYDGLYSEGLVNGRCESMVEHNRHFSFIIFAGEANNPEKVYDRCREYIEKIKVEGISNDDFERMKKVFYAGVVRNFDDSMSIAEEFLTTTLDGYTVFDYAEAIAALTVDDINSLIGELFKEEYTSYSDIYPLGDENE